MRCLGRKNEVCQQIHNPLVVAQNTYSVFTRQNIPELYCTLRSRNHEWTHCQRTAARHLGP